MPDGQVETPGTAKAGEKMFTQDELNAHVESRLARQKTQHEQAIAKEQTEAATAKAELAATVEKLKTLEGATQTAAEREKLIEEVHAGLLKEIPDDKKGLVSPKLSKEDQIRFMQTNKALLFGGAPPVPTPPPSDRRQPAVAKGEMKNLSDFPGTPVEQARAWKEWKATNP